MSMKLDTKRGRRNFAIGFGIFAIITAGIILGVGWQLGWLAPLGIGVEEDEELEVSTFQILSQVDGEDVSDFVELSIWIPEDEEDIEDDEDVFTMALFEEEESSKDADDISIDLREVSYAWIEIDPDAEVVFETHFSQPTRKENLAVSLEERLTAPSMVCRSKRPLQATSFNTGRRKSVW